MVVVAVIVVAIVVVVVVVVGSITIQSANMTMYEIHPFGNLYLQQFQLLPRAATITIVRVNVAALDATIGD